MSGLGNWCKVCSWYLYSVSLKNEVQKTISKVWNFLRLEILKPSFTRICGIQLYDKLQSFIQLFLNLMKLSHIMHADLENFSFSLERALYWLCQKEWMATKFTRSQRRRRRNLFGSNKNTITIDNIIQQLITEPSCQKTILVNYAGHLNTYNFCFNFLN